MPNDDREKQFERALARHLNSASPYSDCPDPDALAAYHERSLSLDEMAKWKEHVAGCERCQETLALVEESEYVNAEAWQNANVPAPVEQLVRTETPQLTRVEFGEETALKAPLPASAAPLADKAVAHIRWRWVVPVGALAAGVIVWIGAREVLMQRAQMKETIETAQNQPAPSQLPSTYSSSPDRQEKADHLARDFESRTPSQQAAPVLAEKVPPSDGTLSRRIVPAPAIPAKELDKDEFVSKQKGVGEGAGGAVGGITGGAAATPTPQPPALRYDYKSANGPSAPVPALTAPVGAARSRSAPEAKKAPGPSATQATQVQVQSQAQTLTAGPTNTTASDLAINGRNAVDLLKVAASDHRIIVTPNEKYVWRVGSAGIIERSSDTGQTWRPQNSGVPADLTAGSATSEKICWVVGKTGTVLLTTDAGKHWKKISSPIAADLGGIHATDEQHALIWDVHNRQSFETNDAGLTWQRIANK